MGALVGLTLLGGVGRRVIAKIPCAPVHLVAGGRGRRRGRHTGRRRHDGIESLPAVAHGQPVVAVHNAVGFHIAGTQNHTGGKQQRRNSRPLQPRMAAPVRGMGMLHNQHSVSSRKSKRKCYKPLTPVQKADALCIKHIVQGKYGKINPEYFTLHRINDSFMPFVPSNLK